MNEQLKIIITAQTAEAQKNIQKAQQSIEDLGAKGEATSSKFSNAMKSIGNATKVAMKATATAIAAVGTGVVALGTAAIKSYAEYEQLVGGVETLFGKSADIVKGYADEAYKTAGLSANAYMETVTGFSASMLQSLGGDTKKAAEYSNQAVIDMADNANKMGTSMESIQNAYAGFAKGNYTMLDNLKLGYGGTKEEMDRLLSDAQKLDKSFKFTGENGTANFADITRAINIVQTELGITGTTAKEAASTISGSTAMAKAAWQNLLTGIADDNADFDALIKNFVDSVATAAENILPRIEVALTGIASLIDTLLPVIVERVPTIIESVLPRILELSISIIQTLADGLISAFPVVITTMVNLIPQITGAVLSLLPQLITLGVDLIVAILNGISQTLPTVIQQIVDIIPDIVDAIVDGIPLVLEAGIELLMAIVDAIPEILPDLIASLPDIIDSILDMCINNLPVLLNAAIQLFNAIVSAIPKMIPSLVAALPRIITSITSALIQALPLLLKAAVQLFMSIVKAIPQILPQLISGLGKIVSSIKTNLVEKAKSALKFDWSLPKLKMPHFSVSGSFSLNPLSIPKFSISWYEKGGVFDKTTLFGYGDNIGGLGENGAEAVVPLEKNLGWLDKLATMLAAKQGGNRPIYLTVDGKVFGEIAVDSINDLTRLRGSLPLKIV